MKKLTLVLALVLAMALALPAAAEVEEITVGGSIQVRGQWQNPGTASQTLGAGTSIGPLAIPALVDADGDGFIAQPIPATPLGDVVLIIDPDTTIPIPPSPADLARFTVITLPGVAPFDALIIEQGPDIGLPANAGASFDDDINSLDWYTQRTRVNVDAKLSGGVRGFVELQSFDVWGDDPNDNAADDVEAFDAVFSTDEQKSEAGSDNDLVDLYQAYIEMNEIAGYPLQVRIGRQELVYGREWLLGNNDAGVNFSGLAFDAVKASYESDLVRIDAWVSKLADFSSPQFAGVQEEDADIDFYGVYGTWKGFESMLIEAYWMERYNGNSLLGDDTSDPDSLHTVGARIAGTWDVMGLLPGMLDYNVEGAYQFGDNNVGPASDSSGDYEAWAFNAMAGYTLTEVAWMPRIELEYAYFTGDDDAFDGDTEEFNRLFSDVHYGELNLGGNFDQGATNLHIIRIGASAVPVEKLTASADFYYFLLAEDDEEGLAKTFGVPQIIAQEGLDLGGGIVLPVVTVGNEDQVGMELDLAASYQYTEDLNLRAGWAHFFADDAIEDSWGAGNDDDVDYVYVQALLVF
ncbi:MAG: DUF1302 family protein [Candidatus Abyssobacteria bacterium SURF_17]|uniref:DUF1302 family protein n=1 Tax=Candidatus Abyssobacteria bacterium SURF_17 TaxID=2093361 RepID=A0A419EWY7_9BACT|nr:MAG: DUF1302 family protein [Candidatus Abyssubacteria bacterium SURF_17]